MLPSVELAEILRAGAAWAAAHPDKAQKMSALVKGLADKPPAEQQRLVADLQSLMSGT